MTHRCISVSRRKVRVVTVDNLAYLAFRVLSSIAPSLNRLLSEPCVQGRLRRYAPLLTRTMTVGRAVRR